jgi:hypothetical protein
VAVRHGSGPLDVDAPEAEQVPRPVGLPAVRIARPPTQSTVSDPSTQARTRMRSRGPPAGCDPWEDAPVRGGPWPEAGRDFQGRRPRRKVVAISTTRLAWNSMAANCTSPGGIVPFWEVWLVPYGFPAWNWMGSA